MSRHMPTCFESNQVVVNAYAAHLKLRAKVIALGTTGQGLLSRCRDAHQIDRCMQHVSRDTTCVKGTREGLTSVGSSSVHGRRQSLPAFACHTAPHNESKCDVETESNTIE